MCRRQCRIQQIVPAGEAFQILLLEVGHLLRDVCGDGRVIANVLGICGDGCLYDYAAWWVQEELDKIWKFYPDMALDFVIRAGQYL